MSNFKNQELLEYSIRGSTASTTTTTTTTGENASVDEETPIIDKNEDIKLILRFFTENKYSILLIICMIFAFLLLFSILISTGVLYDLMEWIDDLHYILKSLLFLLLFCITTYPTTFGYSFIVLACGYVYGFWIGIVTVYFLVLISCFQSFLLTRRYFKESAIKALSKNAYTTLLMNLFEHNQIKTIFLLHFTPLTIGLVIGFLAVSNLPTHLFLIFHPIAAFPYILLGVSIGDSASELSDINDQTPEETALLIIQISISVLLLIFISIYGRRQLAKLKYEMEIEIVTENDNHNENENENQNEEKTQSQSQSQFQLHSLNSNKQQVKINSDDGGDDYENEERGPLLYQRDSQIDLFS